MEDVGSISGHLPDHFPNGSAPSMIAMKSAEPTPFLVFVVEEFSQ